MITLTKDSNQENLFNSPHQIDWATMPSSIHFNFGPFTIEADCHIDQDIPLNSYFLIKVIVDLPLIPKFTLIDTRIDKDHLEAEASLFGAGVDLGFDINKMEIYADAFISGNKWHVVIWKF